MSNSNDAVESFLSGKLSQVDVAKIQSELRRLWLEAATTGEDANQQISRACTCNLVLFTDSLETQTSKGSVLDEVVLRQPSRAILTIWRQAQAKRLEAWVSARCHLVPGGKGKQICSEQITILCEGATEQELLSVIDSLVLGDLPVFLWWTIVDISGDAIGPFLACARRVVVDSGLAPWSFRYLRNLHNIVDSTEGEVVVSDLNWARLCGLRRAIAEEFERSPLALSELSNISKVTIRTNGQELQEDDCSVQALLLTGWIASRLGWTPVSLHRDEEKRSRASFKKDSGGTVEVEFKSVPFESVVPGAVSHLVIEMEGGRALEVNRDPSVETQQLLVLIREGDRKIRDLVMDDVAADDVSLMTEELDQLEPDTVFTESLASACELIKLIAAPASSK